MFELNQTPLEILLEAKVGNLQVGKKSFRYQCFTVGVFVRAPVTLHILGIAHIPNICT